MNIYFSCSITGGRNDQPIYAAIVDTLLANGHTVPTAHLARPEVAADEAAVSPEEVYDRDIAWVDGCDLMVAEVSTPSHGAGYEIAYGLMTGKPVLCLAKAGVKVSKMITGNGMAKMKFERYGDAAEAVKKVEEFLKRLCL